MRSNVAVWVNSSQSIFKAFHLNVSSFPLFRSLTRNRKIINEDYCVVRKI